MKEPWTTEEINEYDRLYRICENLAGQKIEQVIFYLDKEDINFNEQPNEYGKSLLNAVELKISSHIFCLGNLFFGKSYNGLNILPGKVTDFENVEGKQPVAYPSEIVGQQIMKTVIYWSKPHWINYFVPQEIEFKTLSNFLLFSAIEVNNGEVNTPLTNELLVVEKKFCLRKFKLGEYGVGMNERYVFNTLDELMRNEKNTH